MANLNTAIGAASPGDTILLQAGATFSGTMILRHKTATGQYITIKTGVDSVGNVLSASHWPAPTTRLIPGSAADVTVAYGARNYSGSLAKLVTTGHNEITVRTVYPGETGWGCASAPCVASYYRLELLDIGPTSDIAGGVVVAIGTNAVAGDLPAGDSQDTAAEEPHHIVLSQVFIHGTDSGGAKHCLEADGNNITVQHSYISLCWWEDQDAQAIWTVNGTGDLVITNNYLEASGELFLAGGDEPRMNYTRTGRTFTGTPTTNGGRLNAALPDYVQEGDCVSVLISGKKQQACIGTIDGARTGITFSPTLASAPDLPGGLQGGLLPRNLTFTGNYLHTPIEWRGTAKGRYRKNLFELKNWHTATVTGNVMDNVWQSGQAGFAVVITPINQDGGNDSTHVRDLTFSYNRVRNMAGCFNISGIDGDGAFSQRTENITISHVSCENVSSTAYTSGDRIPAIAIGTGNNPGRMLPKNLRFSHIITDQSSGSAGVLLSTGASPLSAYSKAEGLQITNSVFGNPAGYALGACFEDPGGGCLTQGDDSWTAAVSGGSCDKVVWDNENSANFSVCGPAAFQSIAQWEAALQSTGTDAGREAADFGPDQATLLTLTDAALTGQPTSPAPLTLITAGDFESSPTIDTNPTLMNVWTTDRQVAGTVDYMDYNTRWGQPKSGTRSGSCWTNGGGDCSLIQHVTVPTAGAYKVSFWAKAGISGAWAGVNINDVDTWGNELPIRTWGPHHWNGDTSTGFQYYEYTTTSLAAGTKLSVWLYHPNNTPSQDNWTVIDDVTVVKVR